MFIVAVHAVEELPETRKSIKLLPHQKKILETCFTKKKNGRFPWQTVVYSCTKKSGKTEVGGLVGLWYAVSQEDFNEIYFLANDLEHAQSRGFKRVSRIIEENPRFDDFLVKRSVVDIRRTKTEIQALSQDYAGQSGANPGLTVWDELWAYFSEASRRLWTEMAPSPTRTNSMRFIVTYAGYEGESHLLWELYRLKDEDKGGRRLWSDEEIDGFKMDDLYKDALRYVFVNDEAGVFIYWDHYPRMPWQLGSVGEEYYKTERKINRPNDYLRLHHNEWASSVSAFIPIEMWDDCVNPDLSPLMPGSPANLFVGVDIGIKRDSTAVVAVYWDSEANKIKLGRHRIWTPSREEPLDLQGTIEEYLLDLHRQFRIKSIYYDPSQFVRSAQFLSGKGIPLTEYTQVTTNLTAMTQTMFELARGRNLEMYYDGELRQQNLDAVVIEGSRGMRIGKEKAKQKIDAIVAMAMACQAAWDGAGITSLPESQPVQQSTWMGSTASIIDLDDSPRSVKSKWRI